MSVTLLLILCGSGCFLFEDEDAEDLELTNLSVPQEQNTDTDTEQNTIDDPLVNMEEEEEEETLLQQEFQGTWWMYVQYDNGELRTISDVAISKGEYDSKEHLEGSLQATRSRVYAEDGNEYEAIEGTAEKVEYEIDGSKMRLTTQNSYFSGRITVDEEDAYAHGTFSSTLGDGTWFMERGTMDYLIKAYLNDSDHWGKDLTADLVEGMQ